MKFCPVCDNILFIKRKGKSKDKKNKKKYLVCNSCGYEAPFEEDKDKALYTLSQKIDHDGKDKTAILMTKAGGPKLTEEEREAYEWLFEDDGSSD